MRTHLTPAAFHPRVPTGVRGLDDVLGGGLPSGRVYLVEGQPGAGKTTLALQFLLEGSKRGERVLYVSLSEDRDDLLAVARSHEWDLDGIDVFDLGNSKQVPPGVGDSTLYVPGETEIVEQMSALRARIEELRPARIVVDSCTELRLLAQNEMRFRQQVLALKQAATRLGSTLLLIENTLAPGDPLVQSLAHGIIDLEQEALPYGAAHRRLRMRKLRESMCRGDYHDMVIRTEGIWVFPRLVPTSRAAQEPPELVSSGIAEIDALVGGGLPRGTSTLIVGPAGAGKSAMTSQYAVAAAARGEHGAIFIFDEGAQTFLARARSLGMDIDRHLAEGRIGIEPINPNELSPGEFAWGVRVAVERDGVRVLIIDSLNGLKQAMATEQRLGSQLQELLHYLRQHGVLTLMTLAERGPLGDTCPSIEVCRQSDNVLRFHYFEAGGHVRTAMSMMKKRSGPHEHTLREFTLSPDGFTMGEPLEHLRGVLTGVPVFEAAGGEPNLLFPAGG